MPQVGNALGRNGLGLREGMKEREIACWAEHLWEGRSNRQIGFGGIPGLRSEISTPRTKTCPWGTPHWGARTRVWRNLLEAVVVVHGSTGFRLRAVDFFASLSFALERFGLGTKASWPPTLSAFFFEERGMDGAPT